jgi:hypothetical protein
MKFVYILIGWAILLFSAFGQSESAQQLKASLPSAPLHAVDRAFPGAQGFAAFTPGGRGGKIVRVTTLKASGPGSLAEAVRAKGSRIVVFEVGGIIDLGGHSLWAREPFLTIAGQTAPSPGITLIKGGLQILTHDVVIQHLRVRAGSMGKAKGSGWEIDGIGGDGAANVIIDHCSSTWATDENLSASGDRFEGESPEDWRRHASHDITISNCLIAEGLSESTHEKGEHSKGSLIHDNSTRISVIGNLYASNVERNPLTKGGVHAVIVNNWIFNPGRHAIHNLLHPDEWKGHPFEASRLSVVANLLEYGPDTRPDTPLFLNQKTSPLELFLSDNLAFTAKGDPAPLSGGYPFLTLESKPLWPDGLEALAASKVKAAVAEQAGARPWERDEIDRRIVNDALQGKGKIIDSESEVGGYPALAPSRKAFRAEDWDLETMENIPNPGAPR